MFEYHGWVKVLVSTDAGGGDREEDHLRQIAETIQERIREFDSPYLMDLRWMNGEVFIHFGGFPNHRDPEIFAFFRDVGVWAPGSYGLLHVRDDEAPAHDNEVYVIRMVRGKVTDHSDGLLSPCIPILEDPVQE